MADIIPTIERQLDGNPNAILVVWEGLNAASTEGVPVQFPEHTQRSVQFVFTTEAAAQENVSLMHSNDGTNFEYDDTATAASNALTDIALKEVRYTKPSVYAIEIDSTIVVDVYLYLVKPS